MRRAVVVPWVTREEVETFLDAWKQPMRLDKSDVTLLPLDDDVLVLQQDAVGDGCGATKNRGVAAAVASGADMVVVLDGDCYPTAWTPTLQTLLAEHENALQPQHVVLCRAVTDPPSRGTPYARRTVVMPVAASMGFWTGTPDYCAVRQLAFDGQSMEFDREAVFGAYFSLCGMNLAFRPKDWWPWCQFVDVARYDDIWMGWLWQREAYRRRCCFNLAGPLVEHARQSNVWKNLHAEARYAEENETLWAAIAQHPSDAYADLLTLLPAGARRLTTQPAWQPA